MLLNNTSTSAPASNLPGPIHGTSANLNHSRSLQPARTSRTALLLIDIQRGINISSGHFGTERSTPQFEDNIAFLLAACRAYNKSRLSAGHDTALSTDSTIANGVSEAGGNRSQDYHVQIIHIHHQSSIPSSPLHPNGATQSDGIQFMPCATPDPSSAFETISRKTFTSAFADGKVAPLLRGWEIEQLIVGGLVSDHCVGTSVRWASDLGVVTGEHKAIVMLKDGSATFGKGGWDAETVHSVTLASLEGEFAEIKAIEDVVRDLFG